MVGPRSSGRGASQLSIHHPPSPCTPRTRPQDIKLADRGLVWNTDLMEALELENLLANAAITMHSAERRK